MTLRSRKKNIEKKTTVWYCDYNQESQDVIVIQPEISIEKSIEQTSPSLKVVESLSTSEVVESLSTSEVVESLSTSEVVESLSTSEVVESLSTSEVVESLSISEVAESLITSEVAESLSTSEGDICWRPQPSTFPVSTPETPELPTKAKHSLSTSALPTSVKHCKHSNIKSPKSPHRKKRTKHCFTCSSQHFISNCTSPNVGVHGLIASTLPRNCKIPGEPLGCRVVPGKDCDKQLKLEKDCDKQLKPELFGLYLEPGVIRCSFDDYPLTVLEELQVWEDGEVQH